MKKINVLIVCIVLSFQAFAQTPTKQNKFTISGFVRDSASGEMLIGTAVIVKELESTGASTNAYGFYSITIPEGNYSIATQLIGYKSKLYKVELKQNVKLDIKLSENASQLSEVTVTSEKKDENITKTQMGVEQLDVKQINSIPVLFGEKDILKTIQLLPGIQSAGDGNSGFYVRGGGADQNLILLDEAPVYNASHLLGFFSVFNSDAIKDVTVYKGGMPSQYGGRLSSVLDIKMNDGNDQKFHVSAGIGLISSRASIEGPIKKGKGSFIISGRRTYADLFLKLSRDSALRQAKLYFYDINVKANYQIDSINRIFLSGYFGKDVLGFGNTFNINWGNITGTLRWNHLFSEKLFSNTSLIVSNYYDNIGLSFGTSGFGIVSLIQDYGLKEDFSYFLNSANTLKFGLASTYHQIAPGQLTSDVNAKIKTLTLTNTFSWENAVYISHTYKPSPLFSIEYGLRFSMFSVLGPGLFYNYNPVTGQTIDSTNYNSGQIVKTYLNPEPRLAANHSLNKVSSIKASYARNIQNIHLLNNSTSQNPTDEWLPSTNYVKPEVSDQFSLGYFRNFKDNKFEFSTEVYYKIVQNVLDYKDNAQLEFNQNVQSQLLFGQGRAYGAEFFLKKKYGRLNGWIGYTLSKAEQQISGINNGNWYLSPQDRTHDISVVVIYQLAKKWTLSSTFVFYTGSPVTFPSGKYEEGNQVLYYYTERNGYRMPPYNRLDIGLTWQRKKTEHFESSWSFSIYNVYDRMNAYTITFQPNPNNPSETQAVQTSLFGIIPSISYNFKF
jgi:hypothetical protein